MNYPHITKDSKGNIIHCKCVDGYEYWRECDSNGNLIHYKNSTGFEYWCEFDSKGNLIYYKDSDGDEYWYDSNGSPIPNPNEIKELTLEEIAEKFGVSVKSIRIKD